MQQTPTAPATIHSSAENILDATDIFVRRHIGPSRAEVDEMLATLGLASLDELVDKTVPQAIRLNRPLDLPPMRGEFEAVADIRQLASKNKVMRSFIGMGYHDTITPPVILRNILENPGWYTQYTPYQAEIAQGRLEALLNFQTMVSDLTGLPLANASLLDEATAAAEAMAMCKAIAGAEKNAFFISADCHPQTIAVVQNRARWMGIECVIGKRAEFQSQIARCFGVLLQYPNTYGEIIDFSQAVARAHESGALVVFATDLLALTLLKSPGEFGVDIAIGSSQRFGVPLGFGGPHAAFMATKTEHARKMPGRIVGVSKDSAGNLAFRLAIQTREQHIRREKATSNICTAQVLLAIMASMYAVYHGPKGLKRIAQRVHAFTCMLSEGLKKLGHHLGDEPFFDTLRVGVEGLTADEVLAAALVRGVNLRRFEDDSIGISLDETVTRADIETILQCFAHQGTELGKTRDGSELSILPRELQRTSPFCTHPVFNRYHSETEMLRYIFRLQSRDLSLAQSMIPLGSCTMKLNATSEMIPVTWPEFARMHPYAPDEQTKGYQELFLQLEKWLAEITGFAAVSLQPNAGSQGEYAGLLAIRAYHESRQQGHRNVCLIPTSAHGTNPASAAVAGLKIVAVACDEQGNIDVEDLRRKAQEHANDLAVLMVTYPSTHGVFEESIKEICSIVHENGGQVYMDGANMNAQVGLCRPGDIGADVCHLNLHKTFCIPHGGGGPGMGPIGVAKQLAPFLPGDPVRARKAHGSPSVGVGPVSAASHGSAAILPISWMYIAMMGAAGLKRATEVAILNANYMAKRLEAHYPVLFRGREGFCAHEFILDCRQFEDSSDIKVEDIAKRLMDYGFHAPTMSFPVPGTLMIEPTESESKAELDRFCEAMIGIREEIRAIENGQSDRADNVLKNSPHTTASCVVTEWKHRYTRESAAYPAAWLRDFKFWPAVGRIDNPYGDRHLVCTCPPMSEQ